MQRPEPCPKCLAEPKERTERKRCPQCGSFEWMIEHGAHYMGGAREVFVCKCPSPHSALGRRKRAIEARRVALEAAGLPIKNRRVTTPAMAKKAAEVLVRGETPTAALREAGYPPCTVHHGRARINKRIQAELKALVGDEYMKYIEIGEDLTPEEQELMVRGMLIESVLLKTDAGVQAAKQLGADKRVSMWRADSQVGVTVLHAPPVPKINHAVPLLPPLDSDEEEVKDDSR